MVVRIRFFQNLLGVEKSFPKTRSSILQVVCFQFVNSGENLRNLIKLLTCEICASKNLISLSSCNSLISPFPELYTPIASASHHAT